MTIAIYGVGSMGGAILDGLVSGGDEPVLAVVRRSEQAEQLRAQRGERVEVVTALEAAERASGGASPMP